MKKPSILNLLLRTGIFLFSGILICITAMWSMGTSSYYSSNAFSPMKVDAASTPDFIKSVVLDNQNPESIRIEKAEGLTYDPVIFFSVEGDAAQYVSNINPIKLVDGENVIPIGIKVSLPQSISLLLGSSGNSGASISGRIRIKYLNEYIDEPVDFNFTADYLLSVCFNSMNAGAGQQALFSSLSQEDQSRVMEYLTNIITYTANYGAWDEPEIVSNALNQSLKSSSDAGSDSAVGTLPELKLTDKQMAVANIIMPKLMPYLDELHSLLDDKDGQIQKDLMDIEELNKEILQLEQENLNLKKENSSLADENNKLKGMIDSGSAPPEQPQVNGGSVQQTDSPQVDEQEAPKPANGAFEASPDPAAQGIEGQAAGQPATP